MKTLRLQPGKERSLLRRHPWLFESAIASGHADIGETVRVESAQGQFLATAAFSPNSKIRARVWSFAEQQPIDAAFFIAACADAVRARARFDIKSNGVRLVHGEADGLPGLIVNRYDDTLVAQFTAAGVERWKEVIADALLAATGLARLYERSDASRAAPWKVCRYVAAGCAATVRSNCCCTSTTGNSRSTLHKATKPVFTGST